MKKLNFNEMEMVNAGGCGWLKRAARRARKDGMLGAAQFYTDRWVLCKKL